eukprot:6181581-Pyramimonas_sp.AAC.1
MRASTTLPGYKMADDRWRNYLQSGSDMMLSTSQRSFTTVGLGSEPCRRGRTDTDYRRSIGVGHPTLES